VPKRIIIFCVQMLKLQGVPTFMKGRGAAGGGRRAAGGGSGCGQCIQHDTHDDTRRFAAAQVAGSPARGGLPRECAPSRIQPTAPTTWEKAEEMGGRSRGGLRGPCDSSTSRAGGGRRRMWSCKRRRPTTCTIRCRRHRPARQGSSPSATTSLRRNAKRHGRQTLVQGKK
jgi:hypothetical protein